MENKYLDETRAYLNEEERLSVAWELLTYAHMLYSRVYVFKNFDAFSKSFELDPPPDEYWGGLHRENLMDKIKICTAFENYNKAVLLAKGFVVHKIDLRVNKKLGEIQKNNPVLISEYLSSNKFIPNKSGEIYLDGFHDFQTISFSKTSVMSIKHLFHLTISS